MTGSKCGKILNQKTKTTALLRHCLYPKPLDPLPLSISWGIQNEAVAIDAYIKHKHSIGNYSIVVEKCGFIVHPDKGWIGASPDGQVTDLTAAEPRGLIEVKCPFSKREVSSTEACKDPNFFCELIGSNIHLKRTHQYYHQVQLQLYAGLDVYHWCDFCVYTRMGISIERIYPNIEWQSKNIPALESFFDNYIAPELVLSHYKPRYIL